MRQDLARAEMIDFFCVSCPWRKAPNSGAFALEASIEFQFPLVLVAQLLVLDLLTTSMCSPPLGECKDLFISPIVLSDLRNCASRMLHVDHRSRRPVTLVLTLLSSHPRTCFSLRSESYSGSHIRVRDNLRRQHDCPCYNSAPIGK